MKNMLFNLSLCMISIQLTFVSVVQSQRFYECEEFSPNYDTCGRSVPNTGSQWMAHKTIGLADVEAVMNIFQEYILYHNNSGTGFASYELIGINQTVLSIANTVCVQFQIVQSYNCITDGSKQQCSFNATAFLGSKTLVFEQESFYQEAGWTFYNAQFNLTNKENDDDGRKIRFFIQSLITNSSNVLPVPYVAIRSIEISNGECPNRIGPRKTFWVFMLVIFVLLNLFIIIYVGMQYMQHEHRRRVNAALLRHPSILTADPSSLANSEMDITFGSKESDFRMRFGSINSESGLNQHLPTASTI